MTAARMGHDLLAGADIVILEGWQQLKNIQLRNVGSETHVQVERRTGASPVYQQGLRSICLALAMVGYFWHPARE